MSVLKNTSIYCKNKKTVLCSQEVVFRALCKRHMLQNCNRQIFLAQLESFDIGPQYVCTEEEETEILYTIYNIQDL